MPKAPSPKEVRERFADYSNEWRDIQDEAKKDMRYVAGDPWEPEDRRAREDAGRPCIALDLLGQYLNQAINNIRQNKRAIQVTPVGDGSNDKDATHRANIIRGIEYRSNAQAAYVTAFENAINRSYGFARLTTDYIGPDAFEQEIRIKRIPNPDTVLLDPDYKEADASDVENVFVTDLIRRKDFKAKYPSAKIVSFSREHATEASGWIRENYVQVAEFWRVNKIARTLVLIDGGGQGPIVEYEDEIKGIKGLKIIKSRNTESREVVQYLTNGIEIIDEVAWAGTRIPILACFGKELFLDDGAGSKRVLLSMVRLARDPQMLHAYLATQECEEAGMTPKAPFVGYKGQFESDAEAWEYINKIPRSFVQVDVVIDAVSGQTLPLPTRPSFEPNFQAYEMAKDSASRSVQSAMGIAPLPTAAARQGEKSGIALEKIQTAEAIGSFHFTDNYDRFLQNAGWQINELIPKIYDTPRTVPITKADGTHSTMRLNDPVYEVQQPNADHTDTEKGDYGVTVSTGPSYESQRVQASEFVDLLLQNLQTLPIPPDTAVKILALGIKMKDLGSIGDQISDLLSPPDANQLPPQVQAQLQQLQGQIQGLQTENAALHMERAGKQLELASRMQIEHDKSQAALSKSHLDGIVRIIVAQLAAKSKASDTEAQTNSERELTALGMAHDSAHELALSIVAHRNAKDLSAHQTEQAKDLATHQVAIQPPEPESPAQGQAQ